MIGKVGDEVAQTDISNREFTPSENECSGCGKIIFTKDEVYKRCECYNNKSFICEECIEANEDLKSPDICDKRCNSDVYISPSPYEPSENSYELLSLNKGHNNTL